MMQGDRVARLLAAVLMVAVLAPRAVAQPYVDPDTEIARRHFEQGRADYQAGRYADAIREFGAANRVKPHPDFEYNIARCYDRLEQVPEAIAHYQKFVDSSPDHGAGTDAPARIAILKQRLAPTAPPAQPANGATAIRPSAPAASVPERGALPIAAPIAVGAVAVASLATGLGLYLAVGPAYDDLLHTCAPDCMRSQWEGLQAEERAGIALMIVGGAAVAVDTVLWIVRGRSRSRLRALAPAPGGLAVRF